jgi:hypothetical protein
MEKYRKTTIERATSLISDHENKECQEEAFHDCHSQSKSRSKLESFSFFGIF